MERVAINAACALVWAFNRAALIYTVWFLVAYIDHAITTGNWWDVRAILTVMAAYCFLITVNWSWEDADAEPAQQ